jgi:fucose 4-O-acetylase-like acetyltransferase
MQRINWIDWAKALAVMLVVFCHLPQLQDWFYYRFLQACTITIFFFISGYLKKDRGSDRENWKKYWHGLILPYIIYNVLVYPYWLVKYYILNGGMPDFFSSLKPIIGALLFEHKSSFAEPLNGPLWYLPAILFMHVTIDLCRKTRYTHQIIIVLCIISFLLYAANKYWLFLPQLTPMGIFRCLPYYYIGYVMGQKHLFRSVTPQNDFLKCVFLLIISLLLFEWHLHEDIFLLHIVIFYTVNICFLFAVLYGSKALNPIKSSIITNLSIGTLVIIGLHYPVNCIINYLINISCYQWYEAIPTFLFVTAMHYPLIVIFNHHFPFFIGKTISIKGHFFL